MSDYERALDAEQEVQRLRRENTRLAADLAAANQTIDDLCRSIVMTLTLTFADPSSAPLVIQRVVCMEMVDGFIYWRSAHLDEPRLLRRSGVDMSSVKSLELTP